VMNLGIFGFLFALNGNFRHYHVSFRYPRWLERWLQSPGMHHVHHSYLSRHQDKNLGLVTSVWDRVVGTLYIGEAYEDTPWGLKPDEQGSYTTFLQNVLGPRAIALRRAAPARTGRPGNEPTHVYHGQLKSIAHVAPN
jgi:sterol desaturase/sphingolipid hydroxylase (fatty acid hydroxylase superfamily)